MHSVKSLPIQPGDEAFARNRPLGTSGTAYSRHWHKGRPTPKAAILGRRCGLDALGLSSAPGPWLLPPKALTSFRRVSSYRTPHPPQHTHTHTFADSASLCSEARLPPSLTP